MKIIPAAATSSARRSPPTRTGRLHAVLRDRRGLVTNPFTYKTLPYDPLKDFVPIAMIAKGPFVVLANPSVPVKIARRGRSPTTRPIPASSHSPTDGPRNLSGMLAAWLNKLGGSNILQVPYATMPQGVQDTLAGRLQLIVLAVPSAAPQIASGALKRARGEFAHAAREPSAESRPSRRRSRASNTPAGS